MLRFLTTLVSVKKGTRIFLKPDSLFLRGQRNYNRAHHARLAAGSLKIATGEKPNMQAVNDVQSRLLALVKSILKQNAINSALEPKTLLVDVGLTSMDMVNLMLGVESEFDFTIPQSEITPENFQSVETLERMVATQLQLATAA